jgi:hypothetical protein
MLTISQKYFIAFITMGVMLIFLIFLIFPTRVTVGGKHPKPQRDSRAG